MRVLLAILCLLGTSANISASPLHDAVAAEDTVAAEKLLRDGADVNERTYNDFRPLHIANDPAMVELLLKYKPDLNSVSSSGTPLQMAAEEVALGDEKEKWRKIAKLLLAAGADYDIISAIGLDDVERARAILKKHPTIATKLEQEDASPLRVAAQQGREEMCKLLLEHKADPEDLGYCGFTILQEAVKYPRIVKMLIEAGADPKRRLTWGCGRTGMWIIGDNATALHYAASEGVPETINLLIDSGVDIFAMTHDTFDGHINLNHQTALEVAAAFGMPDNAKAIIDHPEFAKGDAKMRQSVLNKSLVIAAEPLFALGNANTTRPKLVELLLDKGAHPNAQLNGHTALQMAVKHLFVRLDDQRRPDDQRARDENKALKQTVDILRRHGAKIDLYSAVAIGDEAEVDRLLKATPTLANARDPFGQPALHGAVENGNANLVKKLLKAGCDVNIRNHCEDTGLEKTALHFAAFWGDYDIAKILIEAGADVNVVAENDTTPLSEALRLNNPRLVRLLLDHGAKRTQNDNQNATGSD